MKTNTRPRVTPSFVVACAALVLAAITGVATAAPLISGRDIAKNAITTKHIKDKAVQTADLAPKTRKALQGRKGPAGRDGVSGYQVVTGDSAASEGTEDWIHVDVACPEGKKALGSSVTWVYVGNDAYSPAVLYRSPSTATLNATATGYSFRGSPLWDDFVLRGSVTCATVR
ncbi:hypothetical protein [Nocardioides sp. TF02-7]|uniref:hypothetical protein n=1 Tax=Nocardioides sp. TF02-7 TaxID=2917724 RepID=UPI001F051E71|nr:hypothetical protein [Nocardioides sp. TF02-7]UMG93257.1 hypothetical protein MF408_02905 [Nocardioides sp. TF02-7]